MEKELIGGTGAEKARHVWKAAQIPKTSALDEAELVALGKRLASAAQWYQVGKTPRPPRERERLEKIEKAATKLSSTHYL